MKKRIPWCGVRRTKKWREEILATLKLNLIYFTGGFPGEVSPRSFCDVFFYELSELASTKIKYCSTVLRQIIHYVGATSVILVKFILCPDVHPHEKIISSDL